MLISIAFDSCWQTNFLEGNPNEPISKQTNPRKFVATSKTRGEKTTIISKDTVMGVLCRLIGDQRKLYQARNSDNYYFSGIEEKISFSMAYGKNTTQELTYLTNKSDDRCAQSSFLGVLSSDNPWFFSNVAPKLWSVLYLDKQALFDFILKQQLEYSLCDSTPKALMARIDLLADTKSSYGKVIRTKERVLSDKANEIAKSEKTLNNIIEKLKTKPPKTDDQARNNEAKLNEVRLEIKQLKEAYIQLESDTDLNRQDKQLKVILNQLSKKFPDCQYLSNEIVYPVSLYAAALYLQAELLIKKSDNAEFLKNKKGEIQIQGFSKQGFNGIRDWLNPLTGRRKKSVGTPCVVQKQSGNIDIIIDVNREKAKDIIRDINNAGVSSFYLGKKGLAYVTDIDTREVKH